MVKIFVGNLGTFIEKWTSVLVYENNAFLEFGIKIKNKTIGFGHFLK